MKNIPCFLLSYIGLHYKDHVLFNKTSEFKLIQNIVFFITTSNNNNIPLNSKYSIF